MPFKISRLGGTSLRRSFITYVYWAVMVRGGYTRGAWRRLHARAVRRERRRPGPVCLDDRPPDVPQAPPRPRATTRLESRPVDVTQKDHQTGRYQISWPVGLRRTTPSRGRFDIVTPAHEM